MMLLVVPDLVSLLPKRVLRSSLVNGLPMPCWCSLSLFARYAAAAGPSAAAITLHDGGAFSSLRRARSASNASNVGSLLLVSNSAAGVGHEECNGAGGVLFVVCTLWVGEGLKFHRDLRFRLKSSNGSGRSNWSTVCAPFWVGFRGGLCVTLLVERKNLSGWCSG